MPLVFTINEATASGHKYNDHLGASYEYPTMYRRIIQPGARFVYYRGSRGKSGERIQPMYLGIGTVGAIRQSSNVSDCLICEIVDYRPFPIPVPFKTNSGETLEPGGAAGGHYYQKGVRVVTDDVFAQIENEAVQLARIPER